LDGRLRTCLVIWALQGSSLWSILGKFQTSLKNLPETNTLAYFGNSRHKRRKEFFNIGTGWADISSVVFVGQKQTGWPKSLKTMTSLS